MRRSPTIKKLQAHDLKALEQLVRTAVATREQLNEYCKVNDHRIDQLERSGYVNVLEKVVDGQQRDIVVLSKRGKDFCKDKFDVQKYTVWNTNALSHDLRLTEMYYHLPGATNWRSESSVRDDIKEEHRGIVLKTCIDATVEMSREQFIELFYGQNDQMSFIDFSEGQQLPEVVLVGVESIGDSYTSQDCTDKVDLAQAHGCAGIIMAGR